MSKDKICAATKLVHNFSLVLLMLVVLVTILLSYQSKELTSVIQTENGLVQGSIAYSRNGKKFWQFLGIPFAKPPVDDLKFAPPEPPENWDSVKQVTSYPPGCARFDLFLTLKPVGQLDCLYLNVFVNVANEFNGTRGKLVLIFLHGGAFLTGHLEMFQPDYFMDQDIVLVSMSYRLGPFGFLNLQDVPGAPIGNMGMLDQIMALKWVQNNIVNFGGDPKKVTLFGESAGAMATEFHMFSPLSQGLFQKAIMQSSNILAPFSHNQDQSQIAKKYAKRMGCNADNSSAVWKCFQKSDWQTVVNYQHSLMDPIIEKDLFQPTVDGKFLLDTPQNLFKNGSTLKIPIMMGVNNDDGAIRSARFDAMPEHIETLDKSWTDLLSNAMVLEKHISADLALKIRSNYFEPGRFSGNNKAIIQNLSMLMTDMGFFYPAHKSALYHAKSGSPVYMFYFNYTSNIFPGTYSGFKATRLDDWLPGEVKLAWSVFVAWFSDLMFGENTSRPHGVGHGEGNLQAWNLMGFSKYFACWDSEFSQSFIKTMVDFANDTEPLQFRNVMWPSINDHLSSGGDEYTIPFMLMDNENIPKVIREPFAKRIKFWTGLEDWEY